MSYIKKKSSDYKFRKDIEKDHQEHLKSKKFFRSCRKCINAKLLQENEPVSCPDCDLYTLKLRFFRSGRFWDLEIYCTNCEEQWRREIEYEYPEVLT